MGAFVTLMIVIPLLWYVVAFWGRLLRTGAVRLAGLAAQYQQREPDGGQERPWEFQRPGEP
jgi:hypothetical protein